MDTINLTLENIAKEHICCALDSKTSNLGVKSKKEWLTGRFEDGLVFKKKLDSRGKVFIEYIPAEKGWIPVEAPNYMLINCHWVSGSYKGQGFGSALLEACEKDAASKNMSGVIVLSSPKKKPYLSDKSFYLRHGYEVADTASPYFELLVKKFSPEGIDPKFKDTAKNGFPEKIHGIDIFYTAQCPFTVPYVEMLKPVILGTAEAVRLHQITSREEAQNHFCPVTTYSVFVNGTFHSQEILTPKKLEQLISKL